MGKISVDLLDAVEVDAVEELLGQSHVSAGDLARLSNCSASVAFPIVVGALQSTLANTSASQVDGISL